MLELPEEIGEVQEAFNIAKEGSYIVTAKNPTIPGPMGLAYELTKEPEQKYLQVLTQLASTTQTERKGGAT